MQEFHKNSITNFHAPSPWDLYLQDTASFHAEALTRLHDSVMFYLVLFLFAATWILLLTIVNCFTKKHSSNKRQYKESRLTTMSLILIVIFSPYLIYLIDEIIDPCLPVTFEKKDEYYFIDVEPHYSFDPNLFMEGSSSGGPPTNLPSSGGGMGMGAGNNPEDDPMEGSSKNTYRGKRTASDADLSDSEGEERAKNAPNQPEEDSGSVPVPLDNLELPSLSDLGLDPNIFPYDELDGTRLDNTNGILMANQTHGEANEYFNVKSDSITTHHNNAITQARLEGQPQSHIDAILSDRNNLLAGLLEQRQDIEEDLESSNVPSEASGTSGEEEAQMDVEMENQQDNEMEEEAQADTQPDAQADAQPDAQAETQQEAPAREDSPSSHSSIRSSDLSSDFWD